MASVECRGSCAERGPGRRQCFSVLRTHHGACQTGTFGDLLPVGIQKVGHRPQRDGGIVP
jgi:hypothetical protein